jgi:hypothetical protein
LALAGGGYISPLSIAIPELSRAVRTVFSSKPVATSKPLTAPAARTGLIMFVWPRITAGPAFLRGTVDCFEPMDLRRLQTLD